MICFFIILKLCINDCSFNVFVMECTCDVLCFLQGARVMTLEQIEGNEPIHENWGEETGDDIDEVRVVFLSL